MSSEVEQVRGGNDFIVFCVFIFIFELIVLFFRMGGKREHNLLGLFWRGI